MGALHASTGGYKLATHEYFWVSKANDAGVDWVTTIANLPTGTVVRWNKIFGPRLCVWERNPTISLWLTTDIDYALTNGGAFPGGQHVPVPISEHSRSGLIQVDQRTPLSLVVADFVEKYFADERKTPIVVQGRPEQFGDGCFPRGLQRVNLNLTAWHHQLSDGDILAFDRSDDYLVD